MGGLSSVRLDMLAADDNSLHLPSSLGTELLGRKSGEMLKGVAEGDTLVTLPALWWLLFIRQLWKKSCGREISSPYKASNTFLNRAASLSRVSNTLQRECCVLKGERKSELTTLIGKLNIQILHLFDLGFE